jgi:hypothetical protein
MPAVLKLARARCIAVNEDCAQAHGARIYGQSVGSSGMRPPRADDRRHALTRAIAIPYGSYRIQNLLKHLVRVSSVLWIRAQ